MSKLYVFSAAVVFTFALFTLPGCGPKTVEPASPATPAPTYRGPEYLRGTIGSLASVRGYEPMLVSGYGFVMGLDGTGSSDAPNPALRQWVIDELSKEGFGRYEAGLQELSPERVFDSDTTALVLVEGIIPAGATRGTRFDLVVSTLQATQATSVRGGTLYVSYLTAGGRTMMPTAVNAMARGEGPIYTSPFASEAEVDTTTEITSVEDERTGVVMAGGVTSGDMRLALETNRAGYRLTRQIADRINAAFPSDDDPIANPQNESVIELNVTEEFRHSPREMLELITHLHMNPRQDFSLERARELTTLLVEDSDNQELIDHVVYSWMGMGRPIQDHLRGLYGHADEAVRLAALRAGVYIGDTRAADPLIEIVRSSSSDEHAQRAAELLGELLGKRSDFARVGQFLQDQLDHDHPLVRMRAYEALARVEHQSVQRFGFPPRKMELAHARPASPMVYLTQRGVPRVVVFGSAEMEEPLFFSAWDNRFMLREDRENDEIAVFYQPRDRPAIRTSVPNNLVHLLGVMAYEPTSDDDHVGLDMSYSEIAYVLHQLRQEGLLDAPLVLQQTDYTERVFDSREDEGNGEMRPETGDGPALEEDLTPAVLDDTAGEGFDPDEVDGNDAPTHFER